MLVRARAKRLAVAELDDIAVRILKPAEIADRVGQVLRRPHEMRRAAPCRFVHRRPAFEREAQMAEIVRMLGASVPALDQHENEILFLAGFRQPGHPLTRHAALMHRPEAAELAVKGDRGVDIPHMQRDMGQDRLHGLNSSHAVLYVRGTKWEP